MVLQVRLGRSRGYARGTTHDNLNEIHILILFTFNLKCMGDHKVVDFWSKGQFINFQSYIVDTYVTRFLGYITLHRLTVRIK